MMHGLGKTLLVRCQESDCSDVCSTFRNKNSLCDVWICNPFLDLLSHMKLL